MSVGPQFGSSGLIASSATATWGHCRFLSCRSKSHTYLVEAATEVKALVDAVSAGSQEQARGIEQIAKAVAHMDRTTQSTAATAEEEASAAEELSSQARSMTAAVLQLRLLVDGSGE